MLSGGEDSANATYRVRRADGTWCWIDGTLRSYSRGDGQHNCLVIARDVTERVEAEQRMRESERRYREVVENAPLGIFVVQGVGVVFANAAAAALYGVGEPGAVRQEHVRAARRRCGPGRASWRARGSHRASSFTIHIRAPTAKSAQLTCVGTAITYNGAPAFQCIVRDVTELGQAQREQSARRSSCRRRASSRAWACSRAGSRTTSTTCSR